MPRPPLIPTLIVGLAVAAMIALGVWQLGRRAEKAALLERYAANASLAETGFPRIPVGDAHLFRRASAMCLEVVGWKQQGAGSHGYRWIAECRTGAEGPLLLVETGTTRDLEVRPKWRGGMVTGTIAYAPDQRPMIAALFGKLPRTLMLVADKPLPGLAASPRPGVASIPNNHLSYAVTWFAFAGVALVIYLLALRRRGRTAPPGGGAGDAPS